VDNNDMSTVKESRFSQLAGPPITQNSIKSPNLINEEGAYLMDVAFKVIT